MVDLVLVPSIAAGVICFVAGLVARSKAPNSLASWLFLLAMVSLAVSIVSGVIYPSTDRDEANLGNAVAKAFVVSTLLAYSLLWELSIVFPYRRNVLLRPLDRTGFIMIAALVAVVAIGLLGEMNYDHPRIPELNDRTLLSVIAIAALMLALTNSLIISSMRKVDNKGRRSGALFLLGFWTIVGGGLIWVFYIEDFLRIGEDLMYTLVAGCYGLAGVVFAYSIAHGEITMSAPAAERLLSSSKSNYRLFLRYVYLVEEPKPVFSFKLFADILKGRCWDCQNDDSFPCESLDCEKCKLPCPCRECTKYQSRPQGLIISRQFPNDIRSKFFLQTTPIVWLSAVAGKDNMDPAKLNLLTDMLASFMEKSHNGVVLVDGIEYLVTTNDFQRVVRAIDRWTEVAMTSNSRLIITVDPKSFDPKELALLERNKEVVRPDAPEKWMIIPEPI